MKRILRRVPPLKWLERRWHFMQKEWRTSAVLRHRYGHARTLREGSSRDAQGQPCPWYTYPAIEYLSHLDFSGMSVFEFGSGNSTHWWLGRGCRVVSVENDDGWYRLVSTDPLTRAAMESGMLTYHHEPESAGYAGRLDSVAHDIVIIDGAYRKNCIDHYLAVQAAQGPSASGLMLILDNSDRYPITMNRIREQLGWFEADFHGFTPIVDFTSTTSIFVNPSRAGELRYVGPLRSIAAEGIDDE